MLVIRFARRGRNKQAFFHLVVAEKARAVQKKIISKLGFLNPHSEGGKGEFIFDKEKVMKYITNGAQLSERAARMLSKAGVKEAGKFVKARPSKPRKEVEKSPEKEETSSNDSSDSVKEEISANNAESVSEGKTEKNDIPTEETPKGE
jgi:small subunit ribosomal protein S16